MPSGKTGFDIWGKKEEKTKQKKRWRKNRLYEEPTLVSKTFFFGSWLIQSFFYRLWSFRFHFELAFLFWKKNRLKRFLFFLWALCLVFDESSLSRNGVEKRKPKNLFIHGIVDSRFVSIIQCESDGIESMKRSVRNRKKKNPVVRHKESLETALESSGISRGLDRYGRIRCRWMFASIRTLQSTRESTFKCTR